VTDPLIDSLRKAVDVSPDDTRLRLHLVELLLGAGDVDDDIGTGPESHGPGHDP
jgi:hypothetical protein